MSMRAARTVMLMMHPGMIPMGWMVGVNTAMHCAAVIVRRRPIIGRIRVLRIVALVCRAVLICRAAVLICRAVLAPIGGIGHDAAAKSERKAQAAQTCGKKRKMLFHIDSFRDFSNTPAPQCVRCAKRSRFFYHLDLLFREVRSHRFPKPAAERRLRLASELRPLPHQERQAGQR